MRNHTNNKHYMINKKGLLEDSVITKIKQSGNIYFVPTHSHLLFFHKEEIEETDFI